MNWRSTSKIQRHTGSGNCRPAARSRRVVASRYLGQDDYGNAIFVCRYTNDPVVIGDHRLVGPMINVPGVVYVAKFDSKEAERLCRSAFDEMDRNCNTCVNLERLPGPKGVSGLLRGRCGGKPINHPYGVGPDNAITFPPDDWMGMECWRARAAA